MLTDKFNKDKQGTISDKNKNKMGPNKQQGTNKNINNQGQLD